MSDNKTAEQLKEEGSREFSAGRFKEAYDLFTAAIQADNTNHILFSNRSAAACQLKEYEKALADAQTTVSLNPKWAKGYNRLATALVFLGKKQEALDAVERGLAIEPTNAALVDARQSIQDSLRPKPAPQPSAPPPPASSYGASQPGHGIPAGGIPPGGLYTVAGVTAAGSRAQLYALLGIVGFVALVLSFPAAFMSRWAQGILLSLSLGASMASLALSLAAKVGRPALSKEWFARLVVVDEFTYLSMGLVCYMGGIPPLPLVAVTLYSGVKNGLACVPPAARNDPGFLGPLAKYGTLDDMDRTIRLSEPGVHRAFGNVEVHSLIYALLLTVAGGASFLSAVLFAQILGLRYSFNGYTRLAFDELGVNIDRGLSHRFVPTMVATVLRKVKSFISSRHQPKVQTA